MRRADAAAVPAASRRSSTRDAGARYEALALEHLERAGLALIARNYACRYGEIDLVMRERDTVVFVEVRHRSAGGFGDGIDSVTAAKRAKLVRAASVFLADHPRLAALACRFDVLAIGDDATAPDWRRNAFEAS
ncbi:MAG TPA: YraN family protein [Rhodanobacteraceae bacterium]|nr:YraN family protein [Rhodanobacteraceae bacterium]